MRQPYLEVHRVIEAPAGVVWDLLTDTSRWAEWGPSIRAVDCPDRFIRKGTRGRVETLPGAWVPFVITEFRPGYFWSWKVFGLSATGHRVDPLPPGRCSLVFAVPPVAAPYLTVCRIAMVRIERLALGERSAARAE